MPQERWNTEWVKAHQVGVVYDSYKTLPAAVEETISRLPELRVNVQRVRNRAVFEVPEILHQLMADVDPPQRPHAALQALSPC